jgi:hypothetical protein
VEQGRLREGRPRVVPLGEELVALGRGEQRQLCDRPLAIGREARKQLLEVAEEPHDRRAVEEVGVVLQVGDERGVGDGEHEVELRRPGLHRVAGDGDVGEPPCGRRDVL